jgi:hypothetical protein
MAILLKADGTKVTSIKGAATDGTFTLKQLQEAVGGFIEGVPGTRNRAWCNEDGRRLKLPRNDFASQFFKQVLLGDVLVMQDGEGYEGDKDEEA